MTHWPLIVVSISYFTPASNSPAAGTSAHVFSSLTDKAPAYLHCIGKPFTAVQHQGAHPGYLWVTLVWLLGAAFASQNQKPTKGPEMVQLLSPKTSFGTVKTWQPLPTYFQRLSVEEVHKNYPPMPLVTGKYRFDISPVRPH